MEKKTNTDRSSLFRFDYKAFIIFVLLFIIEVLIALFVRDTIIRPYGGDFLVVIMIFYFFKSFISTKKKYLLFATLLLAYVVEFFQLFNLVQYLGLEDCKIARIVLGSSFSVGDLIAYTLGVGLCWLIEVKLREKH